LNAGDLLQLAEPDWLNWSDNNYKDYNLGLADLLCHITENSNANSKPVSDFQNLKRTAYIQSFPIKELSLLGEPKQQC